MTPRPLSQGHRRAALGKKENGKAPSVAGGAPEKSLYAIVSAREISLVHPLKVD
jgi:hypothetical protein